MPGFKEVGEILSIIDSSSCEEVVLETQDIKLIVHRRGAGRAASENAAPTAPAAPVASPATPDATAPDASQGQDNGAALVRAPVVGTFYRAPSPDAPPFVEQGSTVRQGDPLCVIEVMKLFTTIHADTDGVIESIGAENAQLVEFGQVLFSIKPG
ncbi:acetyl-CoA carboxylase biotin carboxyl carrier protein [Roseovarius nitratireducens]|uniref:acetyl-CoA carboxylase biotin carboxyl carrier protein n=1 Tax=Roseovarius nitratireducens TaxID=2044597 RepID=UPI0013EB769A|nr:acetyl-CoA carboxylase biotin carboxyl carrier protein [Roseovarius nitratireducens]